MSRDDRDLNSSRANRALRAREEAVVKRWKSPDRAPPGARGGGGRETLEVAGSRAAGARGGGASNAATDPVSPVRRDVVLR